MGLWNKNDIVRQKDEIINWYKQKELEARSELEEKNNTILTYQQQEIESYNLLKKKEAEFQQNLDKKETEYQNLLRQKEQIIQELQQKLTKLESITHPKMQPPHLHQIQAQTPSKGYVTDYQRMENLAKKLQQQPSSSNQQQTPYPNQPKPSFEHQSSGNMFNPFGSKQRHK